MKIKNTTMDNEKSAVALVVDKEQQMFLANEESTRFIAKIIPLLEYRKKTAEKYFQASDYPTSQQELYKLVEHCNKEIKQVLGIL